MKIRVEIDLPRLLADHPGAMRPILMGLAFGGVFAGFAFSALSKYGFAVAILGGFATFLIVALGLPIVTLGAVHGTAKAAVSFVAPTGGSTPLPEDFSFEKSLLIRGRVEEALTELDVRMATHPDDPTLFLFAADVHSRNANDAVTGERLYRQAREMKGVTRTQDYAATNRLIDLYMGPLNDPARAAVELERMQARHPGTTAAAGAARLLAEIRSYPPVRSPLG